MRAADADLLFWNGLNMELGDGWFENLLAVAGKSLDDRTVVALADGIEPLYLTERRMEMNPHAYLDVVNAMQYVRNARDTLVAADPEYAHVYEANAAAYLARLEELHRRYVELLGSIPEERRILVTSERAFQYLAARYGLREGYVWAIDTDEQGTPRQILDLVRFVRANDVPALFVESNVDPRALETVSRETGVPIYAKMYCGRAGRARRRQRDVFGHARVEPARHLQRFDGPVSPVQDRSADRTKGHVGREGGTSAWERLVNHPHASSGSCWAAPWGCSSSGCWRSARFPATAASRSRRGPRAEARRPACRSWPSGAPRRSGPGAAPRAIPATVAPASVRPCGACGGERGS